MQTRRLGESAVVLAFLVVLTGPVHGQQQQPATTGSPEDGAIVVTPIEAQPSRQAPAESFTGSARVDQQFQASAPGRVSGARVTFEPGARTAWHSHPLGQTLIVTSGEGRVQRWGDAVDEIRTGDVVWIPAGQKHWHGAAPTSAMSHIAVAEQLDGKGVLWMEKVSDAQYAASPRARQASAAPPGKASATPPDKAPPASRRRRSASWATSRPSWPSSPTTFSTATCGHARSSRPATAAW